METRTITAELLAGVQALSIADRHHFELNLTGVLDNEVNALQQELAT